MAQKKEKREYLNDSETKDFTARLNDYFATVARVFIETSWAKLLASISGVAVRTDGTVVIKFSTYKGVDKA